VDLDGAPRIASRQAGDGRRLAVDGALDSSFDEDENPLDVVPQSVIALLCRGVAPAEFADGPVFGEMLPEGIVRVNSILPADAPRQTGAPLFLLKNDRRARPDSTPKIAYTYLP
jgi:hypothetical protein